MTDAAAHILIDAEWLDDLEQNSETGLPQVQRNRRSNFNQRCRFTFLKECAPYNVVMLSQNPFEANYDVFAVIDRHIVLGNTPRD